MVKIWGRATSSNVQVAMWTAAEVGLEVERLDVGGSFGGTDTPQFRNMNPNGLIPVLEDGDVIVFESAAIVRYLAASYGTKAIWPENLATRARLDMWAEWTKTTLCPVLIYEVFWTLVRTPAADRDMENLSIQVTKLGDLMSLVDTQIGTSNYIGGDEFTFADIMFGHTLYRYFTLPFERLELPALAGYYERLKERSAYRDHVMVDYSPLQVD